MYGATVRETLSTMGKDEIQIGSVRKMVGFCESIIKIEVGRDKNVSH